MRNLKKRFQTQRPVRTNFVFLILGLLLLAPQFSSAYDPNATVSADNSTPRELKDVGITEKLGLDLSNLSLSLVTEDGTKRPLKEFLTQGRPIILSLVYYSCPSLCNLHLNGVLESLKQLSLVPGKDYDLLAVSFDPKETSSLAAAKKHTYQEKFKFPNNAEGIQFLTSDENSVKILADAIGFKYKWDDNTKEWAHASAAVILTPDGVVSRYLHGVYFEPKTFRLSIVEASRGKIGDIVDAVMLFCFRYDPKASKYALYAFNLMRVGAAAIVVLLLFLVGMFV